MVFCGAATAAPLPSVPAASTAKVTPGTGVTSDVWTVQVKSTEEPGARSCGPASTGSAVNPATGSASVPVTPWAAEVPPFRTVAVTVTSCPTVTVFGVTVVAVMASTGPDAPQDPTSNRFGTVATVPNGLCTTRSYLPAGTVSDCASFVPNCFPSGPLPANRYWVMGDNRAGSRDSRYFGAITKGEIVGRVFVRIWPFNRLHIF